MSDLPPSPLRALAEYALGGVARVTAAFMIDQPALMNEVAQAMYEDERDVAHGTERPPWSTLSSNEAVVWLNRARVATRSIAAMIGRPLDVFAAPPGGTPR